MTMKKCVIIPTYNEKENLQSLIPILLGLESEFDILIVDDSSPDGSGQIVENFAQQNKRVNLLTRSKKEGLGKAYISGFKWCLDKNYEVISQMDADFSHRPIDLDRILKAIESKDFIIGSRYVPGGQVENWGIVRKLISRGGSLYSRLILGFPTKDWTGGFNTWHARVLKDIGLDSIMSNGYSFQIELKYKAQKMGYVAHEEPILFADRRVGQSKMSLKIVLEAFYKVWMIR
jgi:dolichol-phosphate mannosyltransferase